MLRTLFASWHTYLDQSNGASISTRALLLELARRHWEVSAFCALSQDFQRNQTLEEMLASHRIRANKTIAGDGFSTTSFWDSGVKSLALVPSTIRRVPSPSDVALYMRFFKETLVQTQPNVVLSYGGYGLAQPLFREARAFGAKVAVFLHNLAYNRRDYFQHVDIVFVPSHFASELQALIIAYLCNHSDQRVRDFTNRAVSANRPPGLQVVPAGWARAVLNDSFAPVPTDSAYAS